MTSRGQKIAAACALACGLTAGFEGLRTHPYVDPGNHRTLTVCFGDTEVEMRSYTPEECQMLLETRQQRDYAPGVLKCVPGLADKREAFAASIDFAYNLGVNTFCRSASAREFNAGHWKAGCDQFLAYNGIVTKTPFRGAVSVRRLKDGRYFDVLRGLERRREAERSLCLRSAS
jgi:lysozyme